MSITRAIGNAFSGLTANARASEIVSRNVANATVEGYTAKSLALSHQVFGGQGAGVRIDGVTRAGEPLLTAARRRADGAAEKSTAEADILRQLSDLLLDPGGEDSLASRYVALESKLRTLADTPESASVQREAAEAAGAVVRKINALSTETVRIRAEVDREIERQVSELNRAIQRIEALNREIQNTVAVGRDATGLEDERDRLIDVVNGIVPIRATPRENGGMMITTQGGALLLEGKAQPVSFTAAANVQGSNALANGLTWNTRESKPPASPLFTGGSLEAAFTARDETIPQFSRQLDAVARDLVVRFQNLPDYASDDGTGPPPVFYQGLFTDGAARYDETDATLAGLAGRLRLNAEVDPRAGGDPTTMQFGDWPGALVPQPGAKAYPTAAYDAFTATAPAAAVFGINGARTAVSLVSEFQAVRETQAQSAENDATYLRGTQTAMRAEEKTANAVDTDAELKNLLAIEKAYAANARVLQAADAMLGVLLEI